MTKLLGWFRSVIQLLSVFPFCSQISSANLSTDAISLVLNGQGYRANLEANGKASDNPEEITFTLDESHADSDMTAFEFQSLLANISSFSLTVESDVVIKLITLYSAMYDPTSDTHDQINFVENMTCFENYTGLSCESCSPGRLFFPLVIMN